MKNVTIEGFTVHGSSVRTNNKAEASPSGEIPGLWGRFYASQPNPGKHVYGVYSGYESDANGDFTVTAGTKAEGETTMIVSIKSGTYLMFPANGAMPAAIIDAWRTVWEHFSQKQPYTRAHETDFEEYTGSETAAIYIGIKENS